MGKKKKKILFWEYFEQWIKEYKEGAIREVTMQKYRNTLRWLKKIAPDLKLKDVDRKSYQYIINEFGKEHEKQTVQDFHHQLKGSLRDAVDDDYIKKDPTNRIKVTGKIKVQKKDKYVSEEEVKLLIKDLDLGNEFNYDWMIYLALKTGLRFSEVAGLTVNDFDFENFVIHVNKTWNYKYGGGFVLTKNESSVRDVKIDKDFSEQLKILCSSHKGDMPVFILNGNNIYNSTVNKVLEDHCKKVGIPLITYHALRHIHASLLLKEKVTLSSIADRLGHSNSITCQKVYLHVIKELEQEDNAKINNVLTAL